MTDKKESTEVVKEEAVTVKVKPATPVRNARKEMVTVKSKINIHDDGSFDIGDSTSGDRTTNRPKPVLALSIPVDPEKVTDAEIPVVEIMGTAYAPIEILDISKRGMLTVPTQEYNVPELQWGHRRHLDDYFTRDDTSKTLYVFSFCINKRSFVLIMNPGSSYRVTKEHLFSGFRPDSSADLAVILDGQLTDTRIYKSNTVINAVLTNCSLSDAAVVGGHKTKTDPHTYKSYEDVEYPHQRNTTIKLTESQVSDSTVINTNLERFCIEKNSHLIDCKLKGGEWRQAVTASRLTNVDISASGSVVIEHSVLKNVTIFSAVEVRIAHLSRVGLSLSACGESIAITNQFGLGFVNWLDGQKVEFAALKNGSFGIFLPHYFRKNSETIPKVKGYDNGFHYGHPGAIHGGTPTVNLDFNELDAGISWRREVKETSQPDVVQATYLNHLKETLQSQFRIHSLMEAVVRNTRSMGLEKSSLYDDCPF